MVYLLGLNLKGDEAISVGLQKVYGIGKSRSKVLCKSVGVDIWEKLDNVSEAKLREIARIVRLKYMIGVELRREVFQKVRGEMDSRSYRGLRHRYGLPVRGQRTRSNGRTAKVLLRKNLERI